MKQVVAASPSEAARSGAPVGQGAIDKPLAGLVGSDLVGRFRHWSGASGRRYLFSVFPLPRPASIDEAPRFHDAVVLGVRRDGAGERRILAADETGALPELFYESAPFRAAIAAGANEIHVHLLTEDAPGRAALLRDLEGARSGSALA